MKKRLTLSILAVCLPFISSFGVQTLDLSAVLGSYPQTESGYWVDTYTSETNISQGIFRFSHTGSSDAGMGMAYWDGLLS